MNAMLGCWLGVDDFSQSNWLDIVDVTKWIGDKYIPSFINSSNQQIWFEDSAKTLAAVLEKNGTDYEYFFRGSEYGKLDHGYMQQFVSNPQAKQCFEHLLAFVERQLKKYDQ